jgi:hypothetical protein
MWCECYIQCSLDVSLQPSWLNIMLPAYVRMRRFDFFLVLLAIDAVSLQTATSVLLIP